MSEIIQKDMGSCQEMAEALSAAWLEQRREIEAARAEIRRSSDAVSLIASFERAVGNEVDTLEQRYSYCALDPRFREQLSVALKVAGPIRDEQSTAPKP